VRRTEENNTKERSERSMCVGHGEHSNCEVSMSGVTEQNSAIITPLILAACISK
jgi:hypothetical protein